MAWTIEAALEDEAIECTEKTDEGYSFWLKGIPTEIRVVLSTNPTRGGYNFHLSHFIHTPKQIGPYRPSRPWGDDEAYALHLAVTSITQYYRDAVKVGVAPNADWLVENEPGI
ncbi:hypothetical protein [Aeromonas salmonicida]|uniref:hypothetical protein n=1 Tax=Aeromonas salmonicida TaxID=645 RepID=UPI001BAA70FC|nr:hypothetical protein [Aeromonas salmonicida]MBS2781221.1 hypothetical protein [Aeromonas salmonicida]